MIHEWDDAARSIKNAAAAGKIAYVRDDAVTRRLELTGDDPRKGQLLSGLLRRDGPNKILMSADILNDGSDGARFKRTSGLADAKAYGLEDSPVELKMDFAGPNFNPDDGAKYRRADAEAPVTSRLQIVVSVAVRFSGRSSLIQRFPEQISACVR